MPTRPRVLGTLLFPTWRLLMEETNIFLALVKTMWAQGADGEEIARDLSKALMHVIKEGTSKDPSSEFMRLANDE